MFKIVKREFFENTFITYLDFMRLLSKNFDETQFLAWQYGTAVFQRRFILCHNKIIVAGVENHKKIYSND